MRRSLSGYSKCRARLVSLLLHVSTDIIDLLYISGFIFLGRTGPRHKCGYTKMDYQNLCGICVDYFFVLWVVLSSDSTLYLTCIFALFHLLISLLMLISQIEFYWTIFHTYFETKLKKKLISFQICNIINLSFHKCLKTILKIKIRKHLVWKLRLDYEIV